MLSKEENEQLTQVGPGTPMGDLLRRYWHPIAGTSEMKQYPTKLVKVLGESLVLYRDRQGRLGLIGDTCPHRRVSLVYGIPEQDGLRCAYHGWKFDGTGKCLEMPAEPADSTFKERITITAYPVEELGGLVFAYLGPKPVPLLPRWEPLVREDAFREAGWQVIPCNWLQCMENSFDPVHVEYLHGHFDNYVLERLGKSDKQYKVGHHLWMGFEVFDYGVIKRRILDDGTDDDGTKTAHAVLFPHILGGGVGPRGGHLQFRVPIDDTHTYHVVLRARVREPGVKQPKQEAIPFFKVAVPALDEQGQPQWPLLDNNNGQDAAMWYTQGPVADRTQEHLGESDQGIILYRKMLKEQMEKVRQGEDPMNVFRDPEKNICLSPPHKKQDRRPGANRYGTISKYTRQPSQDTAS